MHGQQNIKNPETLFSKSSSNFIQYRQVCITCTLVDKWVEGRVGVVILYDNYILHFWRLLRSASLPSASWTKLVR